MAGLSIATTMLEIASNPKVQEMGIKIYDAVYSRIFKSQSLNLAYPVNAHTYYP